MIFFITFLRALAACIITNAHYTGVYPHDILANGGLLGDVLFFAVSGYCLTNIKMPFLRWYGKRIWRIYPAVIIATALYLLSGCYSVSPEKSLFWWLVYPTYYHFVASIIVLYIPFFLVFKIDFLKKRIIHLMITVAALWLLIYGTAYDTSYYHIDTVREPMIRFLFFESMLLGAWFRLNDIKVRNIYTPWYLVGLFIALLVYFGSKLAFSKYPSISEWQCFNQVILFVLLYFTFRVAAAFDSKLEQLPETCKSVVKFLAKLTLEIYLVQYVLIALLRDISPFPVNWLILTAAIIVTAWLLHATCEILYSVIARVFKSHT